jgi:hypothetical protein
LKTLLCEACDGPCPVPDASNAGQVDADATDAATDSEVSDGTIGAADGATTSDATDAVAEVVDAPCDLPPPADVGVANLPECVTAIGSCKDQCESECGGQNLCTQDACDPLKGCTHAFNAVPCSDGNACTAGEHCDGGVCKGGTAVNCNDGGALYVGNPQTWSYNFGETLAVANLPAVQLPTGTVTLSFHALVKTQDNDCLNDVLNVLVDGVYLDEVCESTGGWQQVHVDLSPYQGRKVSISLAFDTGDNTLNDAEGSYLDDLSLHTTECGPDACTTHAECADLNDCTGDLCVDGKCQRAPEPSNTIFNEDFGDMTGPTAVPQGFALTSSNGAVKWQVSDKRARTGTQSLYGGNPATGKYDNGVSKLQAKLPAIQLPPVGKATLVFYTWRDVGDQDCAKDRIRVYVGGANTQVAEACGSSGGQWQMVTADLTPFASQLLQPIIEFDTVDGSNNGAEGVYVDDVTVFLNSKCADMFEIFESNVAFNWKVTSTNGSVWWHASQNQKYSGISSFRATNEAAKSYNFGAVTTIATTGFPVCFNATLQLRVRTNFADNACGADDFFVRIGNKELYKQCASTKAWTLVNLDLAEFGGISAPLSLVFSADANNNGGEGVHVDGIWLKCP